MRGGRVPSRVGVLVALVALGAPPAGRAQCLEGLRPATKGEREFTVRTLGALESAMPAAPAGWTVAERTEVRAVRSICIGRERQPLTLEYAIRYVRAPGTESSRPDADLTGAHLVPTAGTTAAPKRAALLAEVRLLVLVNARRETLGTGAERVPVSDIAAAFRVGSSATPAAQLDLFLGDWTVFTPDDPAASVEATAHFDIERPHTSVQSLALELDGPSVPVDRLLSALDVKALGDLLNR